MSIYANGLNIQLNEVVIMTFMETVQNASGPVCQVAVTYENLKAIHEAMGQAIAQYDVGLHTVQRDRAKSN